MLKKLFSLFGSSADTAKTPASDPGDNPAEQALLRQIALRSKDDPLIGAKIGSKEITHRLMAGMKDERGVHIESLLCALGALAGYSCQASLRAQALAKGMPADGLLTVVQTDNGQTFFFGDHLNKPLAESQYSVWSLAAGGAQQAGCTQFPDLAEIFKHTSTVLGTDKFGLLCVPEAHQAHDLPLAYVQKLWPSLNPTIKKYCPDPEHWPVLLGLSIQEIIVSGKSAIEPGLALRIVMEAAIPMSKIDLPAP
jgi:hypothetical protein